MGTDTTRVEAFSDGVFAVAITLLILDIKVPAEQDAAKVGGLITTLASQWPSYLAYLTSFLSILIMWINHHNIFHHIRRADHTFLVLNGLLLLTITVVPFATSLLAAYLRHPDRRTAALVYTGTLVAIAIAFNAVWRYASQGLRLLDAHAHHSSVERITKSYRFGPLLYLGAMALALVSVVASLLMCLALALYFALPTTSAPSHRPENPRVSRHATAPFHPPHDGPSEQP